MSNRITDVATIRDMIARVPVWYHRVELAPGIVTPGMNDTQTNVALLESLGLPKSMAGMRVLDIGCADGFFSFEAEKRGAAEVIAIDYRQSTTTGFSTIHQILGSNVKFYVDNVYNVSEAKYGKFDLVLFLGLLYHLRNPLLALDQVRSVVKTGGYLAVETQMIDQAFQLADGSFVPMAQVSPQLADIPIWQFYPGDSLAKDATNKWAPNMAGLKFMLEEAQFNILGSQIGGARGAVYCQAIQDDNREFFRKVDSSTGMIG